MKFLWDTPNTEAQLGVPPPCIGVYLLPALPTGILLPLHRHDGSHLPCMVWSPLSQQSLTADMETTHVFF